MNLIQRGSSEGVVPMESQLRQVSTKLKELKQQEIDLITVQKKTDQEMVEIDKESKFDSELSQLPERSMLEHQLLGL